MMDRTTPPDDALARACMSSAVGKETIIQLAEAAKAACAEHDILRRNRKLSPAWKTDEPVVEREERERKVVFRYV